MPKAARLPKASPVTAPPSLASYAQLTPPRALLVPLAFTVALGAFVLMPGVRHTPALVGACGGAAALLLAWNAALLTSALRRGRTFTIEVVLRKQHYIQACAQGSVLLYWGWYWREVYHSAHLIAAQLLFAYAFDILLTWSRRDTYALGFGPFPVIFSINLFLWFKPDWFYLQFLMVAIGFAAKELIRWEKNGKRVHIFNPSSFPLGLFSLVLIVTGTTQLTWGPEIASTLFYAPHIYLFIFLIGLAGQFFFGVTTMTASAALTMYAFGLLYYAATGTYYFFDEYIPIAVFLGMHLLFTDPSTSPQTGQGRIIFGMLYAIGVVILYNVLGSLGAPTFYDKLLAVPLLNLTVKAIDRIARSKSLAWFDPAALGPALSTSRRNLAYIAIWSVAFGVMSAAQGVGDTHRGHWVPFWQQACQDGRRNGCRNLATMEDRYCEAGSGWACNELGILFRNRAGAAPALEMFRRACALDFAAGCQNASIVTSSAPVRSAQPGLADYRIVLREGKGPLPPLSAVELNDRACGQGWQAACDELAAQCKSGLTEACQAANQRRAR